MSTISGSFSETTLLEQRVLAESLMFDDRIKQQYIPNIAIIPALKSIQTANVMAVGRAAKKDVDVEVIWQNVCGREDEECGGCNIGGNPSSTNAEDYALSWCRDYNFSENEEDYLTNEFDIDTAVAKQLIMADKTLSEAYARYTVAQLEAFKGINALNTNAKGIVQGSDTFIEPAFWSASLVAYFNRVAILNKLTSPIMISGNNLYEQFIVSQASYANAGGKGDWNLWGSLKMFFDLFNIDTVNYPNLVTYMLSMGSVALANKFYNPGVPARGFEMTRYTMPSQFIPGFTFDVFYKDSCTEQNRLTKHDYTVRLKADLFLNPFGCDEGNTGILSFTCGTPTP